MICRGGRGRVSSRFFLRRDDSIAYRVKAKRFRPTQVRRFLRILVRSLASVSVRNPVVLLVRS